MNDENKGKVIPFRPRYNEAASRLNRPYQPAVHRQVERDVDLAAYALTRFSGIWTSFANMVKRNSDVLVDEWSRSLVGYNENQIDRAIERLRTPAMREKHKGFAPSLDDLLDALKNHGVESRGAHFSVLQHAEKLKKLELQWMSKLAVMDNEKKFYAKGKEITKSNLYLELIRPLQEFISNLERSSWQRIPKCMQCNEDAILFDFMSGERFCNKHLFVQPESENAG